MTLALSPTWLDRAAALAARAPVVRITLIRVEGSAPREAGAGMLVTATDQEDTIGGGSLEHEATRAARALIAEAARGEGGPWRREVREYPLGPALCQCCGGYVWALLEVYGPAEAATLAERAAQCGGWAGLIAHPLVSHVPLELATQRTTPGPWHPAVAEGIAARLDGTAPADAVIVPGTDELPAWFLEPVAPARVRLHLYGAGHVGREIVRVLEGLPFDVVWIDTDPTRFPATVRDGVEVCIAPDPTEAARTAPPGDWHLVMTYSHPFDEAICATLLARGDFGYLGLIGSATKRARFIQRFRSAGIADSHIARLVCPIGIPGVPGKAPAMIAVSVAADLVARLAVAAPLKTDHQRRECEAPANLAAAGAP